MFNYESSFKQCIYSATYLSNMCCYLYSAVSSVDIKIAIILKIYFSVREQMASDREKFMFILCFILKQRINMIFFLKCVPNLRLGGEGATYVESNLLPMPMSKPV